MNPAAPVPVDITIGLEAQLANIITAITSKRSIFVENAFLNIIMMEPPNKGHLQITDKKLLYQLVRYKEVPLQVTAYIRKVYAYIPTYVCTCTCTCRGVSLQLIHCVQVTAYIRKVYAYTYVYIYTYVRVHVSKFVANSLFVQVTKNTTYICIQLCMC